MVRFSFDRRGGYGRIAGGIVEVPVHEPPQRGNVLPVFGRACLNYFLFRTTPEKHPRLQPLASGPIGKLDDGLMQFGHAFHDGKSQTAALGIGC